MCVSEPCIYDSMIWLCIDLIVYFEEASGTLRKWHQFYSPHPKHRVCVDYVLWRENIFPR